MVGSIFANKKRNQKYSDSLFLHIRLYRRYFYRSNTGINVHHHPVLPLTLIAPDYKILSVFITHLKIDGFLCVQLAAGQVERIRPIMRVINPVKQLKYFFMGCIIKLD